MRPVNLEKLKPKTVLGVAAHPDDLDFGAAGTFAKWAEQGTEIFYLILTNGSKGSSDRELSAAELVKTRQAEQKDAAKAVGAKDVFFCNYEDCCLECCNPVKLDVARCVRKVKPDVVVTIDPTMVYVADIGFINHPDHRAAGQATLDAVFPLARDHLSFPELLEEGLDPHITPTVLLINFEKQNWFEDISGTIDKKIQALAAHESQGLSGKAMQEMVKDLAADQGRKNKCRYGEGFIRIDVM